MSEDKKKAADKAEVQADVKPAVKQYVHQLRLHLRGGQTYTLNEITVSTDMPANVIAFINAWREKKDVWHSPANDPRFGVRVLDVSLYEYRVAELAQKPAEKAEEAAPEAAAQ